MSRDVIFRGEERSYTTTSTNGLGQVGTSTSKRLYVTQNSYRGDVVASDGHRPTAYKNFRWKAQPATGYVCFDTKPKYPQWNARRELSGTVDPHPYSSYYAGDADPNSVPSWVVNRATNQLIARLSSNVDIGQFLGELPSSMKMIASTAITVLRAYRAARRGKFSEVASLLGVKKVSDLPKGIANGWLAYKFGWLPLITDVYNMHGAIKKQLNRPALKTVKGRAVTSLMYSTPYRAGVTLKGIDVRKGCQIGVTYRVSNETLAALNALGLINPLSLAWELLPMSFVVDWFIPVGSFLESLSAPVGLTFLHGYVTRYAYGDIEYTWTEPTPAGYTRTSGGVFTGNVKSFGFARVPLVSFPLGKLWVQPATLSNSQMTTLGALLAQRKGRL